MDTAVPLRVDFTFRTPMVVSAVEKPFDGPLARAAVDQAAFLGHADPLAAVNDIGLQRHVVDFQRGQWCFKASYLELQWFAGSEPQPLHRIKRQRVEDYVPHVPAHTRATEHTLLRKMPGFDASRGATKAGSYIYALRWVERASVWLVASDEARVRELLGWITHLGKLAHLDLGAVSSCEVAHDERAIHAWARRPLPLESPHATSHVKAVTALRPPYWKRSEHEPGMLPL